MPGALGFLTLKTIHAHWPTHFFYNKIHDTGTSNNHSVQPNLFLSNQSEITTGQLTLLNELSKTPSIVLVHNLRLIPSNIIDESSVFTVYCDSDSAKQANFLYWFKNTKSTFEWVQRQKQFDFYQAAYQELVRMYQQPDTVDLGTCVDFRELNQVDSLIPLLDIVENEYQLDPYILKHEWYVDNYNRSVLPMHENLKIYNYFIELLHELDKNPTELLGRPYQEILTAESSEKFKTSIDFFYQLYKNQNT